VDEGARLELMSIVNEIPYEEQLEIAELPEAMVILLHHGLGTAIRNQIRSGELKELFRRSRAQVPEARSLDDMAWPILKEIWRVVRSITGRQAEHRSK
jgi:hypothetical protein